METITGDGDLVGITVPLVTYQTDADYAQVVGEDEVLEMSFFEHLIYIGMFGQLANDAGVEVVFVQIKPGAYFAWLEETGYDNTTQRRAAYAVYMSGG